MKKRPNDRHWRPDSERIPLSTVTITAKAKSFSVMLKEKAGSDYDVELLLARGPSNSVRIVIHS